MTRKLAPGPLIVASHNQGKVKEFNDLLGRDKGYDFVIKSAGELGLPEPEETAESFAGNAALKAAAAAGAARMPAIADDSGLAVAALGGAPGIYSARWAGPERDFALAMARVEAAIGDLAAEDLSARFVCALALAWPDGHIESFEGEVAGELVFPARGGRGFGYDPIFLPAGETETFGEMDPARKHAMSHRAEAFRKLTEACFA